MLHPYEALADYRRRVAEIYRQAREIEPGTAAALARYRSERDRLFADHPQSALTHDQKQQFRGLSYFPFDPAFRVVAPVEPVDPGDGDAATQIHLALPDDGLMTLTRFGRVRFALLGHALTLSVFWMEGYAGGIFVPFLDATSGTESYGAGRYLLDTRKHADLGSIGASIVLDFNYAYNPSCAYNPAYTCPLLPAENRLPVAIRAGEKSQH